MLGQLPTSLEIRGVNYDIRSDYRNILQIISAFDAPDLKDGEKALVGLRRMYVDFEKIPTDAYKEAYEAAVTFIECGMHSDGPSPKVVSWEKDSQLIFAAINKVAGHEVRADPYMHWWTFLGYFQNVDRDDLWGFVLTIRQKRAKGKKLEQYETEFYNANRAMCDIGNRRNRKQEAIEYMEALYNELHGKG